MKIKRGSFWGQIGGVVLFVAGAASGCGDVPGAEGDGTDAPAVETKASAVTSTACRTGFWHGDNISAVSGSVTVGCTLSPGFHRTNATASNIYDGNCGISSWTDRNDPHSGQVNVYWSNSGGWATGFCTVTVTQDPDPVCAHSLCTTGVALVSNCSAGATTVCNFDSFCCANNWDSICVSEAASLHAGC